jgi:hypothetical protein
VSHSNKYLHCTKCREEGEPHGMTLFVTPTGDLGVECMMHSEFVMVIPNNELSQTFLDIAMQPCGNEGCTCESEVSH